MGRMKDLSIHADGPDVTHDPLCTMATDTDARDFDWCMCPLIAKVRADERAKWTCDCALCNESAPDFAKDGERA